MTGSTTRRLLGAGLVVATFLATAGASGQDAEPLDIIPLEPIEFDIIPLEPVESDIIDSGTVEAVEDTVEPPPVTLQQLEELAADGLEVDTLPALDTGRVGTIGETTGGFSRNLWRDSDGVFIVSLMGMLGSGTQRVSDLTRRLLLTTADPPADAVDDWLGLRIETLIALGLTDDAADLMQRAGRRALQGSGSKGKIDVLLLAGDGGEACREVRAQLVEDDDPYLATVLVFCQRLEGAHAAAELSLTVLRDAGVDIDPRFLVLDRALATSVPADLVALGNVTPLMFAMVLAGAAEVSIDFLEHASLPVLRAIADRAGLPVALRLAAAERATARGFMEPADLAALYLAAGPSDDTHADPLSRAQMFQDLESAVLAEDKARLITTFVQHGARAPEPWVFRAVAMAAATEVATLTPGHELGWFSTQAVLTLLAAGAAEDAARWWPLIEQRALLDHASAAEAAVFWPLLRLWMGDDLVDDGTAMHAWWRTVVGVAPERARRLGELYLVLLAALGDRIGEPIMHDILVATFGDRQLVPRENTGDAGLVVALSAASRDGRLGEALLLSTILLASQDPSRVDIRSAAAVISALKSLGLEREARLLALEVAFANAV
ncbi:MAG: hypothetical protein OXU19_00880 [bacterium]|nr:hypothetical protein [bacterium]MDE0416023.1 hypothetical protein [bacterium]